MHVRRGVARPHRPADGRDEQRWPTGGGLTGSGGNISSRCQPNCCAFRATRRKDSRPDRPRSPYENARLEFTQVAVYCPSYEGQTGPRSSDLDGVILQDRYAASAHPALPLRPVAATRAGSLDPFPENLTSRVENPPLSPAPAATDAEAVYSLRDGRSWVATFEGLTAVQYEKPSTSPILDYCRNSLGRHGVPRVRSMSAWKRPANRNRLDRPRTH